MQMTTAALDRYLSGNQMRLDPKKWAIGVGGWRTDSLLHPSSIITGVVGGAGKGKRGCVNPRLLALGSCSVKE